MMRPGTNAIDIRDLVKRFGSTVALDHLDLTVPTGQVHGFLGPNGAGKSTTIRVLLGLLRADSGTATLLGGDPWSDAAGLHRRLAYLPGDVSLWPNLSGGECIDLLGRARGGLDQARRKDLIARFDLDPRKKARTYSKGNRQKVALIAALASDVELLLLDEPTSGLDPLMERTFTDYIRAGRAGGVTVLLSSHILTEVEALCDHVSIIRAGRVVETGTLDDLRHLHRTEVTAVVPEDDTATPSEVAALDGVDKVERHGHRLVMAVDEAALGRLLPLLVARGATGLTCNPPTLEELFMQHYDVALGEHEMAS